MDKNRIAVAFGSFDIIHPGHLHYLKKASRYGRLIVVVSRDSSIRKIKGFGPAMDERARREIVGSLKFVDRALLGNRMSKWNDIYEILKGIKPSVIVLGYDQKVDMAYLNEFLSKNGIHARIVRIGPYKPGVFKSSKIKEGLLSGESHSSS